MGEKIMSTTISIHELATEARRLAQQFPDRTAVCTYTRYEDGKLAPNCIVGQAAFNLGVSLEDLSSHNSCGIRYIVSNVQPEWLSIGEDEHDNMRVFWLGALQGAQDGAENWGAALRIADRRTIAAQFDI
jgi:hypothetical protein